MRKSKVPIRKYIFLIFQEKEEKLEHLIQIIGEFQTKITKKKEIKSENNVK